MKKFVFPAIIYMLLLSCSMPSWVPFFGEDEDSNDDKNSSPSSETSESCRISPDLCLKMSIDDCFANSGTPVRTCNGNNNTPSSSSENIQPPNELYPCQISSICIPMSIEECLANSGTPVNTCNGNGNTPSSSSAIVNPQPPSSSSRPSSSSAVVVPNNPNLLWDLYKMGGGIETGGGWYDFNDSNDGGGSSTNFNCSEISCPWQDRNGAINISFSPYQAYDDYNGYYYNAYVGVGFVWLASGNTAPSVWGSHTGLCVEYSLSGTGDFYIKINTFDYLAYDDYRILLPKRTSVGKAYFAFNNFEQEGWGNIATLATAKSNSIGINFHGSYSSTASATLTLRSVSWDSCN